MCWNSAWSNERMRGLKQPGHVKNVKIGQNFNIFIHVI